MYPTLTTARLRSFFPEFQHMRREMDEAFQQLAGSNGNGSSWQGVGAALSVWEQDDHIYIELDVPGFTQNDLEMTFEDGRLVLRGERKLPQDQRKYWHNERGYGRFERVIALPDYADPNTVEANLENGVLYISIAKREEAKPKKIAINVNSGRKVLESKSAK